MMAHVPVQLVVAEHNMMVEHPLKIESVTSNDSRNIK